MSDPSLGQSLMNDSSIPSGLQRPSEYFGALRIDKLDENEMPD
jgi:hypothetical protein